MNRVNTLIVVAGLFAAPAFADCESPAAPDIPDGKNASESRMERASEEVQKFVKEGKDYLDCVTDKQMALAADATREERAAVSQMYDDMLTKMSTTTAEMRSAAREFRQQTAEGFETVDQATQDEQEVIAEFYNDMLVSLQNASEDVRQAWNEFQRDTEEAE